MATLQKSARTELAQEYAELYELFQEHYRTLLHAIRDDNVGLRDFNGRAYVLYRNLTRLKQLKMRLEELKRSQAARVRDVDAGNGSK